MKNFCLLLSLLLLSLTLNAQTTVSGGILHANTTWAKQNSPYTVTDSIIIPLGITLTIEPGTIIKFEGNGGIDVLGNIILNGTQTDSIIFYKDSLPTIPDNVMLYIPNNITINYCSFKNSYSGAIAFNNNLPGTINLTNCTFNNNYLAISSGTLSQLHIQINNCTFTNNQTAIPPVYATVKNSTFNNNIEAINQVNSIYNSTFLNNSIGIARADSIVNCSFYGNNTAIGGGFGGAPSSGNSYLIGNTFKNNEYAISLVGGITTIQVLNNLITGSNTAILLYGSYFNVQNNIITKNTIGIKIPPLVDTVQGITFTNNTVCNNSQYNLEFESILNVEFSNNCWCSIDSAYIISTIYDGYENPYYGYVNFIPFTSCSNATIDTIYGSATYYTINQPYKFYVDSVAGITYIWTMDGDTIGTGGSVVIDWESSGIYNLTCTAYDSGSALSSYTLPIDAYGTPLAVVPGSSSIPFTVYPNPNNGKFNLVSTLTNANLSIYNSLGATVQTMLLTEQQTVINLSGVVPGIYYLVIESDKGSSSQKIIVEN